MLASPWFQISRHCFRFENPGLHNGCVGCRSALAKVRGGLLQLHMTGNELITDEKSEVHGLILPTCTGVPDGIIESLFGALVERNHVNHKGQLP